MKLWMSGEVDADVGDAYRLVMQSVTKPVNSRLTQCDLQSFFEEWAVVGIIRSKDHSDYNEFVKKHTKRKVLEFRLKINHDDFLKGDFSMRKLLLIKMLYRSTGKMKEMGVPDEMISYLNSVLQSVETE